METISLAEGLNLTIVSMLIVFIVLAAIWGLVELVSKFIPTPEPQVERRQREQSSASSQKTEQRVENPKNKKVAELMALILASEDQPNKKFEIIESKRVK